MPRRNTRSPDVAGALFHVYDRESDREAMFRDDEDRRTFIGLLKRHLSRAPSRDERGRPHKNLRDVVRLVAFALKENHFHLVLYQVVSGGVGELTRPVLVAYTRYFNRKYGTCGSLFVDATRRRLLTGRRDELDTISYVHDNHGIDCRCEFCSHRFYVGDVDDAPSWIGVRGGLELFGGVADYERFRRLRWERKEFSSEPYE